MAPIPHPPLQEIPDVVRPDYNIHRYSALRYKIVRSKCTEPRIGVIPRHKADGFKHSGKLSQAVSRARRVCLEIALCNDWQWFATFTISSGKFDRKDLDVFYKRFREWIKYQRDKYNVKLPYLLVPEHHADGSWHMHGFFNADVDQMLVSFRELNERGYRSADGKKLPRKLILGNFYNWPAYQKRFGFCSFGKIQNHDAAAFYVVKYISKSFEGDNRLGRQLYFVSEGLNRSTLYGFVYGPCPALNAYLTNDYEYCQTGWFVMDREPGDDPLLDIIEENEDLLSSFRPDDLDPEIAQEVDDYFEFTQLAMKGFS